MNDLMAARQMLEEFKGDSYVFGVDCFARVGELAARLGPSVAVVAGGAGKAWGRERVDALRAALARHGVSIVGDIIPGARPNSPRTDVLRIAQALAGNPAAAIIAMGGGSVIDAAKGANAFAVLGDRHPDLAAYFGVGQVRAMLAASGRRLRPLLAVASASGSAAHLTKYANLTDEATCQKKLIIDEAVIPELALFDYRHTVSMSREFTSDGALDGVSHALEVFYGLKGEALERATPVCLAAISLIVNHLPLACAKPDDLAAREALGLGTDLGGEAIMIGGTNGAHLTSFSLVDLLPHGRACALMNPYYTVFFAPAITGQLRAVARIFAAAGHLPDDGAALSGRELGLAVAQGMIALSRTIGFPTTLGEVDGFSDAHVARALHAAKQPQLASKLQNMPVPMTAALVDEYMGPVLTAATTGDFSLIRNLP